MIALNLNYLNKILSKKTPQEIIAWASMLSNKKIISTSFGSYSSVLLHAISKEDQDIDVVWCDTGYNTQETYEHAQSLIHKLKLNIHIYKPLQSKTVTDTVLSFPKLEGNEYDKFKDIVKLEPFRRALKKHSPEVWFTNIRSGQTKHRDALDILSYSKDGILKVSPYYYASDQDLDNYLEKHGLPKNETYFDITKVLKHKECGIHFQ
jgi:phosphoadenosine phosphosulfate reductase